MTKKHFKELTDFKSLKEKNFNKKIPQENLKNYLKEISNNLKWNSTTNFFNTRIMNENEMQKLNQLRNSI